MFDQQVSSEVSARYRFSKYLIDPNKFRLRTTLRVIGLVFLFILKISKKHRARKNLFFLLLKKRDFSVSHSVQRKDQFVVCPVKFTADTIVAVFHLLEDLLKAAKGYFFEKAALGVNYPRKFDKISVLKDEISGSLNLADECLDLAACSFCVHITGVHFFLCAYYWCALTNCVCYCFRDYWCTLLFVCILLVCTHQLRMLLLPRLSGAVPMSAMEASSLCCDILNKRST